MTEDVPQIIKVELITEPSIKTITDVGIVGISVTAISIAELCWMDSIFNFLAEYLIPDDEKQASKVRRIASRYWLSADRKLYWRSFGRLYLLCLHPGKVNEVLTELREGVWAVMWGDAH